ncbi:uncharacterized protein LOC128242964 [Mya arenaria]|uniref:uncharacterized protein LOC128242964 n=1 Tax=Mya arenaria TaxID=6604 RepID=UPI0022E55A4D|nr:uncharacterized protein LOC128242964 [Mya arenaria]
MDEVLLLSDRMLLEMMTYERNLQNMRKLLISYSSTSKRLSTTEAQLGTIRMTVQGGLLSVYHTYGTKKWAAIQEMSEELVQRAHTAGFPHIAENMRISTEGMEAYEERVEAVLNETCNIFSAIGNDTRTA